MGSLGTTELTIIAVFFLIILGFYFILRLLNRKKNS